MSPTLEKQLATYGEHLDALAPPVTEHEFETRSSARRRRPLVRRLAIAVAAAMVVLCTIGIVAILAPFGGEEPPPATDPPTPVPGASSRLNDVSEIAVGFDGSLWAVTGGGVVRWDLATRTPLVFDEQDGLPSRNVQAVAAGPGSTWVAGREWVAQYDGSWTVFTSAQIPELDNADLGDLAVGPDGTVWVAYGLDGLVRFNGTSWSVVTAPPPTGFVPWTGSLTVAPDGTVWASGRGLDGVFAFDGVKWRRYTQSDGLPGPAANVAVAADDIVWVGGEGIYGDPAGDLLGAGVARFDGTAWTSYTTDDGLLSNEADIVVGADGTVWGVHAGLSEEEAEELGVAPRPAGISRFDGTGWIAYPEAGGDRRGSAAAADGTLWMASSGGVIGFDGTNTTVLAVSTDAVPGSERLPAITLSSAPGDLLRISTIIGDLEFTTLQSPPGFLLMRPEATPHGLVAIDAEASTLRWSADGVTWEGTVLPIEARGIAVVGDELVVTGGDSAFRFGWNGEAWSEIVQLELEAGLERVVGRPRGWVAVEGTNLLYSADGVRFTDASLGPAKQDLSSVGQAPAGSSDLAGGCNGGFIGKGVGPGSIGTILATDDGFVAFTAAHPSDWHATPICEPLLWFSPDGDIWELISMESPFGDDAYVRPEIAQRGQRFVAAGGIGEGGAVWVSDGGLSWERTDVNLALAGTVAGGDMGWMLTGLADGADRLTQDMWFSADGYRWDGPYLGPAGLNSGWVPAQLAVGKDTVFGIGGGRDFVPVIARLQN